MLLSIGSLFVLPLFNGSFDLRTFPDKFAIGIITAAEVYSVNVAIARLPALFMVVAVYMNGVERKIYGFVFRFGTKQILPIVNQFHGYLQIGFMVFIRLCDRDRMGWRS